MKPLPAAACALLLASCSAAPTSAPWPGELQSWGTLHEALRDGRTEARVAVADAARPGVYAVGAAEGLRGEVTIFDGEPWVSRRDGDGVRTSRAGDASATVLFAAEVPRWTRVEVGEPVAADALEDFVAARAREAGLDPAAPFPFAVEGGLRGLALHVVDGQCPIRARATGSSATPYELSRDAVDGRLVGIFDANGAGVSCHMGARTHVHALLEEDGGVTGHVERVGLAPGAALLLPAR